MNKIELLAPAKDIVKAKIAVDYGADAIYIGGKHFSLRSRASNFELKDIEEIVKYAHDKKVKVYVTVNMVFHDEDFEGLNNYLKYLENIGVDGIIVSSLGILKMAETVAPKLERHISTQLSVINSDSVKLLKQYHADRVVLARECSISEIKTITKKCDLPVEVFIHGGMCSNFSGRCTLSNRMTNRDANRGGCAHSCRWKYHIIQNKKDLSNVNCLFSMSSKDLRATRYIEDMIYADVASLKIEGRMKSEYYIAQVVKTYRRMIDEIYLKGHLYEDRIEYYEKELDKAENRPSDDGFLSGKCDNSKHLYDENGAGVTHDYVGLVKNYDPLKGIADIEVKNAFSIKDKLEVFGPLVDNNEFINKVMYDSEWKFIETANKPTELIHVRLPFAVHVNDMIRKAHE